jgi:hypothetical protein
MKKVTHEITLPIERRVDAIQARRLRVARPGQGGALSAACRASAS